MEQLCILNIYYIIKFLFNGYAIVNNIFRKEYIDCTGIHFCVNIAKIENIITLTNTLTYINDINICINIYKRYVNIYKKCCCIIRK